MSNDELRFDIEDGLGIMTLNRPQARNAITFPMYDRMAELCQSIETDGAVRAVIITGAGDKAFAAGTDINRFRSFESGSDALAYEQRIDDVLAALERVPVPTIAAIHGACTGGGAAIAMCCDLRIASPTIRFGFPIARTLGNCLSAASLRRAVSVLGANLTRELLITARLVEADEAQAIGLLTALSTTPLTQAKILGQEVAKNAPLTIRAVKEGMRRLRDAPAQVTDEDLILSCYESADFREGMAAFFEKRPPQWQGR